MQAQASINHSKQPFGVTREWSVPAGTRLGATRPIEGVEGAVICRVNGGPGFASRAAYDYMLAPGDVVEWLEFPNGGGKNAGVFQLVLAAAISIYTGNPGAFAIALAGTAAAIIDAPDRPPEELKDTSSTYTTGLQGNAARLYNVIPKICGRMKVFPPYAAQPYSEFNASGEQYFHAIMAVGIGNHEVERILIDDTDISHFDDVLTVTYLAPGVQPASVLKNVINSPEVGSQEMLTGVFVGGFAACGPRRLATHIGIDVIAPRGLGATDLESGDLNALTITWRVDIRSLNEFGTPLTPWSALATETRTVASKEPQRWSNKYTLATPIRPEIRLVRLDAKAPQTRFTNEFVWAGMRAYLQDESELNPNVAHIEVVMRSSKQLTGISQNRICVIATGMSRELLEDLTFGDEVAHRNGPQWLADMLTSTTWGEGRDPTYVDLETLYALKVIADERQDRFDFCFDTAYDANDAAQLIADTFRAIVFDRSNGVRSVWRDQPWSGLPRTAFHTRNTLPGSMSIIENLPREDMADGYIVEYFDNRSWNYGHPIDCPVPGLVGEMVRPIRLRLQGITGRIHANREGLFRAAKMALRRRIASCVTEAQGQLPALGSPVRWQSEITRWQAGDVVTWDLATLTATLSEPPPWSGVKSLVIVLEGNDGFPTEPIGITQGAFATQVVLSEAPPFDPVTDSGTRERTKYILGALGDQELIPIVATIGSGGKQNGTQLYEITAFVDDDRTHAADNALLPSPGEIQDPIDTSEGEPGGGTTPVVILTGFGAVADIGGYAGHRFTNEGRSVNLPYLIEEEFEWLYTKPIGVEISGLFEIYMEVTAGDPAWLDPASSPLNTWLNLATTREWFTQPINGIGLELRAYIREVATGVVQATANGAFIVLAPI